MLPKTSWKYPGLPGSMLVHNKTVLSTSDLFWTGTVNLQGNNSVDVVFIIVNE